MYLAGFLVAGFIVAGVYAYDWLKGRRDKYMRAAMIVPLTFACLIAPVQLIVGDWAARTVAKDQPLKLAAFEGLNETEKGGAVHDRRHLHRRRAQVRDLDPLPALDPRRPQPRGRSRRARHRRGARPPADQPGAPRVPDDGVHRHRPGAAHGDLPLHVVPARPAAPRKWFYRALVAAGPLAVVALICGWITTEVGRQPWVVYEVFRTEDAVTDAGGLPFAFAGSRDRLPRAARRGRSGCCAGSPPRPPKPRSPRRWRATDGRGLHGARGRRAHGLRGARRAPTSAPASGTSPPAGPSAAGACAAWSSARWRRSGRRTTSG